MPDSRPPRAARTPASTRPPWENLPSTRHWHGGDSPGAGESSRGLRPPSIRSREYTGSGAQPWARTPSRERLRESPRGGRACPPLENRTRPTLSAVQARGRRRDPAAAEPPPGSRRWLRSPSPPRSLLAGWLRGRCARRGPGHWPCRGLPATFDRSFS